MTQDGGRLQDLGMQRTFRATSREQRRKSGVFYTPQPVARFMARNILAGFVTGNKKLPQHVKAMDLSCGAGVLLIAILEEILKIGEDHGLPDNFRLTIAGNDIDASAVDQTNVNVQRIMKNDPRVNFLVKVDLKCVDALAERDHDIPKKDCKYDIIIGNPPYIPWDHIERERRAALEQGHFLDVTYSCRPNHKDAQPNLYLFFCAKAASMIADDGIICLLLPIEWLYHERARDFRNFLASRFGRIELYRFSGSTRLFDSGNDRAGTTSMILSLYPEGPGHFQQVSLPGWNQDWTDDQIFHAFQQSGERQSIPFNLVAGKTWIFPEPWVEKIKEGILRQPVAGLENREYFDVRGGFQPPICLARFYEINQAMFESLPPREQRHVHPLVYDASEIKRYVLKKREDRYWILANQFTSFAAFSMECPRLARVLGERIEAKSPNWWCFPNIRNEDLFKTTKVKLLAPRTASKPTFALDDRKHVFKGTNTMIISKILDPRYVLGVLNSEISRFWHQQFSFDYHGGMARKFEPAKIRMSCIPVKIAIEGQQQAIIEKVDMILDCLSRGIEESSEDVIAIQNEINNIVYGLYGISGEQRDNILRSMQIPTTVTGLEQGKE